MQVINTAEVVSAVALLIELLGLLGNRNREKSTKVLIFCAFLQMGWNLVDFASRVYDSPTYFCEYIFIFNTLAFVMGGLCYISYVLYSKVVITERTTISPWFFRIPIIIMILDTVFLLMTVYRGEILKVENGVVSRVYSIPGICSFINICLMIYLPFLALIKLKQIGKRYAFVLAFYSFLPLTATAYTIIFGGLYFTPVAGTISIMVVCVFLQNRLTLEKHREYQNTLAEKNEELASANEELNCRLEEITALNEEIKTGQDRYDRTTKIVSALSDAYLNVYLVNVVEKNLQIVKLDGYITTGLDEKKAGPYPYDITCEKYISSRVYKEDIEKVTECMALDNIKKHTLENMHYEYTYRVLENGKISHYEGKYQALDDTYIVCGFQNIDALVEAEEARNEELANIVTKVTALNDTLTEYNDIIANAGFGVWHIIQKEGKKSRMQVNSKMEELLGVDTSLLTEEEIYSVWYSRILPEAIPSIVAVVRDMVSGKIGETTYKWNHPTQGVIYVRCGGTAVTLDDGTVVLRGYHANVTEIVKEEQNQKQLLREAKEMAEKNNKELAEQFDIINSVSKAFNSIYYVDMSDYSFIELGVNVEQVSDIIGKKGDARKSFEMMYKHLVVPEQVDYIREFTDLTTLNERLRNRPWISCQFYGPVGGWSEGIFIAASRDESGLCKHIIWATRDIDENKKRELSYQKALEEATMQAEAASAAKTEFLFNMSHDIRTPMNAIIGYTELLEKNYDKREKFWDYLSKIRSSSDFLLSLINDVLQMARIESGKITLDEVAFKPSTIINEIRDMYSEGIKAKGITFVNTSDFNVEYVYGDTVKLKEIILNIISNSLKYTPVGGRISVDITEIPCDLPGYIRIKSVFSDTGIGMSEEFLPRLFEEFTRAGNETETKIKGTGLGMPIVKKLVELMNGTIEVESELGKGTTFTIVIPHRVAEGLDNHSAKDESVEGRPLEGKCILLAEDNELNAEIAMELLSDMGIKVEHAKDGIECIDMLQKSAEGYYDLILMDIQMPNMDGYKATGIIRDMQDEYRRNIPIIAMTANAFDEDKKNALGVGMNDHISKPINVPVMIKTLVQALSR